MFKLNNPDIKAYISPRLLSGLVNFIREKMNNAVAEPALFWRVIKGCHGIDYLVIINSRIFPLILLCSHK